MPFIGIAVSFRLYFDETPGGEGDPRRRSRLHTRRVSSLPECRRGLQFEWPHGDPIFSRSDSVLRGASWSASNRAAPCSVQAHRTVPRAGETRGASLHTLRASLMEPPRVPRRFHTEASVGTASCFADVPSVSNKAAQQQIIGLRDRSASPTRPGAVSSRRSSSSNSPVSPPLAAPFLPTLQPPARQTQDKLAISPLCAGKGHQLWAEAAAPIMHMHFHH